MFMYKRRKRYVQQVCIWLYDYLYLNMSIVKRGVGFTAKQFLPDSSRINKIYCPYVRAGTVLGFYATDPGSFEFRGGLAPV